MNLHSRKKESKPKEFFYIGHYIDKAGNYVLKPGTTNDLDRRKKEHDRAYRKTPNFPMADDSEFTYDFYIKLSKYNTLRVEDRTKEKFQNENFGEYMRNDRFVFPIDEKPQTIEIIVRKTYTIQLGE